MKLFCKRVVFLHVFFETNIIKEGAMVTEFAVIGFSNLLFEMSLAMLLHVRPWSELFLTYVAFERLHACMNPLMSYQIWNLQIIKHYLWKSLIAFLKIADIRLLSIMDSLVFLKAWVLGKGFMANRAVLSICLTIRGVILHYEGGNARSMSFCSWNSFGNPQMGR